MISDNEINGILFEIEMLEDKALFEMKKQGVEVDDLTPFQASFSESGKHAIMQWGGSSRLQIEDLGFASMAWLGCQAFRKKLHRFTPAQFFGFGSFVGLASKALDYPELKSKLLGNIGRKGGIVTHKDKKNFQSDYRAERLEGGPRSDNIKKTMKYYPEAKESTLETWAKEADKEDDFVRKAGRPAKNNG